MALSLLLSVVFATSPACSRNLKKLVMPGALVSAHAKYEDDCKQCHEHFGKERQGSLCLVCHDEIAADRKAKVGFHGKRFEVLKEDCRSCHTDHVGRGADIIGFQALNFDHDWTDFSLRGLHRSVQCDSCHDAKKKFREASTSCVDCHRDRDPHRGHLGEDCAKCHASAAWKVLDFDHGATPFPLLGKHRGVRCSECHIDQRFKNKKRDCVSCHELQDVHTGGFGKDCKTCHTPNDWKRAKFDHDRNTKFPLRGKHREASCASCHHGNDLKQVVETTCYACHARDDDHQGRFGNDCGQCHRENSWKRVAFDHTRDTKFPLRGRHADLRCGSCHGGGTLGKEKRSACIDCHRKQDVHRSQEGDQCQRCHVEQGWLSNVRFDHELSRFPLLGLHAAVGCEQCHQSSAFKDASSGCDDCHAKDDSHRGGLGKRCETCHNPNGWDRWRFNHQKQTRFALEGAHEGLACDSCHKKALPFTQGRRRKSNAIVLKFDDAPRRCGACHAKDDAHFGEFGSRCANCHDTKSFRSVVPNARRDEETKE